MQSDVIYESQPYGLGLSEKLLPELLRNVGYATHIVGKVKHACSRGSGDEMSREDLFSFFCREASLFGGSI